WPPRRPRAAAQSPLLRRLLRLTEELFLQPLHLPPHPLQVGPPGVLHGLGHRFVVEVLARQPPQVALGQVIDLFTLVFAERHDHEWILAFARHISTARACCCSASSQVVERHGSPSKSPPKIMVSNNSGGPPHQLWSMPRNTVEIR